MIVTVCPRCANTHDCPKDCLGPRVTLSDRDFIRSGGVNHRLPRQLLEELEEAERCLTSSGFRRSADERTWVPPVNETAGKYYQILPVFEALLRLHAKYQYVEWFHAGGPNPCQHGRAEGIACPVCDMRTINNYVKKLNQAARAAQKEEAVREG